MFILITQSSISSHLHGNFHPALIFYIFYLSVAAEKEYLRMLLCSVQCAHTHTHRCLGTGRGQSWMGPGGAGLGAGRKIGGNNYLHIFHCLISPGRSLADVPQSLPQTSHRLSGCTTAANLPPNFILVRLNSAPTFHMCSFGCQKSSSLNPSCDRLGFLSFFGFYFDCSQHADD